MQNGTTQKVHLHFAGFSMNSIRGYARFGKKVRSAGGKREAKKFVLGRVTRRASWK